MMFERIALGGATLVGALVAGIGLGNYTVGGFNFGSSNAGPAESADASAMIATSYDGQGFVQPTNDGGVHVCTGCDAGLRRDQWQEDSYVADSGDYIDTDYETPIPAYVPKPLDLAAEAAQSAAGGTEADWRPAAIPMTAVRLAPAALALPVLPAPSDPVAAPPPTTLAAY